LLIDISTIRGLFIFNIFVAGTDVLIYWSYGLIKIVRYSGIED
jgi:hypothetical protein